MHKLLGLPGKVSDGMGSKHTKKYIFVSNDAFT